MTQFPANFRVLPFFASHWLDGRAYNRYLHAHKENDLVVVSNWAPFKRHWTLFQALRRLPTELQVALIGQPEGTHTVDRAQDLAQSFGVKQKIKWYNRAATEDVQRLQATAHGSLILSLREGSCLVVAESMLANVPVGMFRDAHIGSSAFINSQTGAFLEPSNLAQSLGRFITNCRNQVFSPRNWALQQIDASLSSHRLNELLQESAQTSGKPWTRNIEPFCLRGAIPDYLDSARWNHSEIRGWHEHFEQTHEVYFLRMHQIPQNR